MRRVAYLTGRSYRGTPLPPGIVPDAETVSLGLIKDAGAARGIEFDVVYWDEMDLASRGYELAVIRTCWDYTNRAQQFLDALSAHEAAGLRVLNSPDVVRWNFRKTYLKDLGAAAIETVWADKVDEATVTRAFDELGADEIVVKPQVGAGSVATVRLKKDAWSVADLADGPPGAAMIQPFLKAIATEGERSLFWFGGVFSHAIRKVPASGDWLANIPGKTHFVADAAPAAAMEVAEAARARAPQDLLYVRIDLVMANDGSWRVIEIEAIEPYLFLDFAPEGAGFFVDAIARVLG
jgi:glutathione synthase/RimK-type ligase-like ATP-grasp enzyme